MNESKSDPGDVLCRARGGDTAALAEVFDRYRSQLHRMLAIRLDHRLRGRVDPSDVLQDAFLEVSRSLEFSPPEDDVDFFVWLRMIVARQLQTLHRHHLGTRMRDARRELAIGDALGGPPCPDSVAESLMGRLSTPSQAAVRDEMRGLIRTTLDAMEPSDREVLVLRHFEQLGNAETARILGISPTAASNRYVRSLARLKALLEELSAIVDRPSTPGAEVQS